MSAGYDDYAAAADKFLNHIAGIEKMPGGTTYKPPPKAWLILHGKFEVPDVELHATVVRWVPPFYRTWPHDTIVFYHSSQAWDGWMFCVKTEDGRWLELVSPGDD